MYNSFNKFVSYNISISISFSKCYKVKIKLTIKKSIFCYILNNIKNSLTLCRNIIYIIIIKFFCKLFNIYRLLRIKLLWVITTINPFLIALLNTSSNLLTNKFLQLLSQSRVTSQNNFCIISPNYKIMRIFIILSNIPTNYSFH